jgi:hypothetical protein
MFFRILHVSSDVRLCAISVFQRMEKLVIDCFFFSHMSDDLVLELITISLSGLFSSDVRLCAISVLQGSGTCV